MYDVKALSENQVLRYKSFCIALLHESSHVGFQRPLYAAKQSTHELGVRVPVDQSASLHPVFSAFITCLIYI